MKIVNVFGKEDLAKVYIGNFGNDKCAVVAIAEELEIMNKRLETIKHKEE